MNDLHYQLKTVFDMQAGFYLLALSAAFILLGCSLSQQEEADQQTAFQVRSDFKVGLNADRGWGGGLNEDVTVNVEEPFRLRFELESDAEASRERSFRLQYRHNGGKWTNVDAQRFPKPTLAYELNFEKNEVGDVPEDWHTVRGNASDMEVAGGEEQPFLQVKTGQEPHLSLGSHQAFWEPVKYEPEIRLPTGTTSGAGIIFGYDDRDNYYSVYLDPDGVIQVIRYVDGEENIITEKEAAIEFEEWLAVEIEIIDDSVILEYKDDKFTADLGGSIPPSEFGFYVPGNSEAELRGFIVEGKPRTPRVSIVEVDSYQNGEETTNLLGHSGNQFIGGHGVNFDTETTSFSGATGQSEWEWPLVIRRFTDGAMTNDEGDTFEFRMAYEDGSPIPTDTNPTITASVPPRLLAGTFPETPGRVGPWEASNGDLYFLMEPAETYNVLMTVKSTDGGQTWREVDGANRPETGDLEGFASDYENNTIHMLHQTSNEVLHHTFHTSDHPTDPDTWQVRDDTVATPEEPPTQVAALTVRSDGSMVGVYGGPEKIYYKIRSTDGRWGEKTVIDADLSTGVLSGPMTVLGEDDVVHLAYTEISDSDGSVWYRRIGADGLLTPRVQLDSAIGTSEVDRGSVLPLVFLPETNTVVAIYRLATGKLWARQIIDHGAPTEPVQVSDRIIVQSATDSDQTGADAIAAGGEANVLFIEKGTGSIYHTRSDEIGVWEPASLQVEGITGQWVRGMPLRSGGETPNVYGYVYDAGSNGGSGMNWYDEVPLDDTDTGKSYQ